MSRFRKARRSRSVARCDGLPLEAEDGLVGVTANFAVYRMKNQQTHCYVGSYRHLLERGGERGFRFVERTTVLDHDALRPHGKLSFIL